MVQGQETRGVKRSNQNQNQNGDTGKRRAPYALRACDACRRRKGKCDGQQPCKHCTGRRQNCNYSSSFESDDWHNSTTSEVANGDTDVLQASEKRDTRRTQSSTSCNQENILEMLSTMRDQLDSLASRVQSNIRDQPDPASLIPIIDVSDSLDSATMSGNVIDTARNNRDTAEKASRTAVSQNFYGPTSPDYALNVAQLKLRRGDSHSRPPLQESQLQLASIDEQDVSDDDYDDAQGVRLSLSPQTHSRADLTPLLTFRTMLSLQETIKLIHVYQEVVGDLHPVIDINALVIQTRSWYSDPDCSTWDADALVDTASYELLLILNIVLAIALSADSNPGNQNNHSQYRLRDSFQDAVNAKVTAPANSIKHVAIIFLKGWYDFFQDMPRSAWRMCGIAGRTLMELGLHNSEVSRYTLNSEASRTEGCTLMSSILILDRQWSSATGLPMHFSNASFSTIPNASVKNPYLKAMLSFILISDQFSEPISKVAMGEGYDDEAAFDLMNFQIEQWRKKAVGDYSIDNCQMWQDPSSRPPTWTILLNLRAKSVRSLLLKPFFFSEATSIEKTKSYARPAAELVHDIVDTLYMLDITTDIYRKQHPHYQHILACACSLYFLLITFIKQNKGSILSGMASDLEKSLADSFLMAVSLTAKYTRISRSARRLAKRLEEMRVNLRSLEILKDSGPGVHRDLMRDRNQGLSTNTTKSLRRTALAQPTAQEPQSYTGYSPALASRAQPGIFGTLASDGPENSLEMGWADSLRLQWPIGDVNNMFSESIF